MQLVYTNCFYKCVRAIHPKHNREANLKDFIKADYGYGLMEKKAFNRIYINAIFLFIVYNLCMKNIVCISGKQYSGKDTLAKILLEELIEFKRIGIGDAIKIEYGKIHNLTFDEINSNKGVYRTGLIELGNRGRNIDPDYWLKKILEMDNIIVPDVRLIHEADVFKQAGAYLIRLNADYETRKQRGIITNENDLTEIELDNYKLWNYEIENNSDYETLKNNTIPLVKEIKAYFKI